MVSACLEVMLLCLFYRAVGENFDRQASIRRSLIYTDTVVRRPKKVKRRKTITGIPDNIQKELGMAHQNCALSPAPCHCLSPLAEDTKFQG
uniref:Secreted protein n=1 Tax=Nothoprocta perdicaria TaxID=30464 RepID=A0A8C6Z8S7_NOTPE